MEIPQKLERYELRDTLGSGAMGTVHTAWDPKLHREVAIKILRAEVSRDAKIRGRFEREARAVAALRHPNIVEIYDYSGEDSELLYIVMEKLEGDDLFNIVADHGPMPEPIVAAVGHELCSALGVAHEAGIVHRDLKPENVFISPNGRIVLTDFGIVKAMDESAAIDGGGMATDVIGTPGFMPPELMMNKGLGPYTDVFALGALLYNIATGVLPYDGPGPVEIFRTMMKGEFADPREHNKSLSEEFCQVLAGALEPKPKRRTQTVAEVRDALKAVLAGDGVTDLRDDMREYMADPPGFWDVSRKRTSEALLQRIKIAAKDRDHALAHRLKARLDAIDPNNEPVRNVSGLIELPEEITQEKSRKSSGPPPKLVPAAAAVTEIAPVPKSRRVWIIAGGATLAVVVVTLVLWRLLSGGGAAAPTGPAAPDIAPVAVTTAAADDGDDPGPAPTAPKPPPAGAVSVEIVIKGGVVTLVVDGDKHGKVRKSKVLSLVPGEHVIEVKNGAQKLKKKVVVEPEGGTLTIDLRKGKIGFRE